MNTELRKGAKTDFEKNLFNLINNSAFGKTMENVRKHRDIKLVTTEKGRNYLVPEPNYHTTKFSIENLLAIKIRKTQILMNKLVYLGLSIFDLILYDYVKLKCGEKAKLYCIDSFIVYIKTDLYKDIKTLQKILKQGLTLQIINWKDHYRKEGTKRLFFFFLSGFSFTNIHDSQDSRERGKLPI